MAKKVIFFKKNATQADKVLAKANGMVVREPGAITGNDFIERCDAVCGDVPESYAHFEKVDAPVANDDEATRDEMKAALTEAGINFPVNISNAKLTELYAALKDEE
jgi:hypothetical protein